MKPTKVIHSVFTTRSNGSGNRGAIRPLWEFFELCVVMLTASDHILDANQAYHLGANSFLVMPLDFQNAGELARFLDMMPARGQH